MEAVTCRSHTCFITYTSIYLILFFHILNIWSSSWHRLSSINTRKWVATSLPPVFLWKLLKARLSWSWQHFKMSFFLPLHTYVPFIFFNKNQKKKTKNKRKSKLYLNRHRENSVGPLWGSSRKMKAIGAVRHASTPSHRGQCHPLLPQPLLRVSQDHGRPGNFLWVSAACRSRLSFSFPFNDIATTHCVHHIVGGLQRAVNQHPVLANPRSGKEQSLGSKSMVEYQSVLCNDPIQMRASILVAEAMPASLN